MGKLFANVSFYSAFVLFILVGQVVSRHLQYNDLEMVSDGVSDVHEDETILRLKGSDSSEVGITDILYQLFLIVIYGYLLYHGESCTGGEGRIFRVLGKDVYVSIFSQLLESLPESLVLLASGLSCSQEKAQEYVVTGAGLLAGSSILLLTLIWGTCFIYSRRRRRYIPDLDSSSLLTRWGVRTDLETSFHAKVMFFSLIPFLIILFPSVFGISYSTQEHNIILLVSLSASVICLIGYFCYQCFEERIWKRRLEYAEVEHKAEMNVPFYEVQAILMEREKLLMYKQKVMEKMLKNPETRDKTMSNEEFYDKFAEWLDDTRKFMDAPYLMDESYREYNQVVELLLEEKNQWIDRMSRIIIRSSGEKLLKEDGTLDESALDSFIDDIYADKEKYTTLSNQKGKYKEILENDELEAVIGDEHMDKAQFRLGVKNLLASGTKQKQESDTNIIYKFTKKEARKREIYAIVGVIIVAFLAEPLVESVRQLSESLNLNPFYVSFIFVPLATSTRRAVAAFKAASQKRDHITSLTFSEIYHKVFLNNILGFCVLVSVIYFRGFTWHFSAEILVVVIVCIIMGLLASFRSKFPNWTLLIAFPLYPLSMVFVYLVNDAFQFT